MTDAERLELRVETQALILRHLVERQIMAMADPSDDAGSGERRASDFRAIVVALINERFGRVSNVDPRPAIAEMTAELDRVLEGLPQRLRQAADVQLAVSHSPSGESH